MISKGKFRELRDLYGYSDFTILENTLTGELVGRHRGQYYTNLCPVSCHDTKITSGTLQPTTLTYALDFSGV